MLKELQYPFDAEELLRKKKKLKRILKEKAESHADWINVRIAVLGGSTTKDIIDMLELFLLDEGIEPEFYESHYNRYWEDAVFGNEKLDKFHPDIVYFHTTGRNISEWPDMNMDEKQIDNLLELLYSRYHEMWMSVSRRFHCTIIQNDFELPDHRLLGNLDAADKHGRVSFVSRVNQKFFEYARETENFYIHDINYIASCYGLQKWLDAFSWAMYKYAMALKAVPEFSYNLSNIIKSLYGKRKKGLVLDLDNTLWGGTIGDDGTENIAIGEDTGTGELYSSFQRYIKKHKDIGIFLAINSKNDEENVSAGFARPDSVLKEDDFVSMKANWNLKSQNLSEIAREVNVGEDSLVFVDDNPAERHIVRESNAGTAVPEITSGNSGVENYIHILDRCGYFETTVISGDDRKRNEMYKANAVRSIEQSKFADYGDYLESLEMKAWIEPFSPVFLGRIAQLTNKSNQFNLTVQRYSQAQLQEMMADFSAITLCGRLQDRFGDNGVVSVVAAHLGLPDERQKNALSYVYREKYKQSASDLHIDLWLMSCRVLQRNMEYEMLKGLVQKAKEKGVQKIYGYYYPTKKNHMVSNLFQRFGFEKAGTAENGDCVFEANAGVLDMMQETHIKTAAEG